MTVLVVLAVVIFLVAAWVARTPPRARVPSHSAAYDRLHASAEWRRLRTWVLNTRAHGNCEARWCRKRKGLQLHCTNYRFLPDGFPTPEDVQILCPRHHHRADNDRRRRERTRRARRQAARVR